MLIASSAKSNQRAQRPPLVTLLPPLITTRLTITHLMLFKPESPQQPLPKSLQPPPPAFNSAKRRALHANVHLCDRLGQGFRLRVPVGIRSPIPYTRDIRHQLLSAYPTWRVQQEDLYGSLLFRETGSLSKVCLFGGCLWGITNIR